jgi:hypothetical protein
MPRKLILYTPEPPLATGFVFGKSRGIENHHIVTAFPGVLFEQVKRIASET